MVESVNQSNINTTICVAGYSGRVRPPTSYTEPIKSKLIAELGGRFADPKLWELDHRVPLELGGAPRNGTTDLTNPAGQQLWIEPYERTGSSDIKHYGAESKDRLENRIHDLVCSGGMTLAAGQSVFLGNFFDWRDAHLGVGF